MFKFRDNKLRILVATSILAFGIDILAIDTVINFDMPRTIQIFTHRIGRTGRIGSTGTAITYFNDRSMKVAGALIGFLKVNGQTVPECLKEAKKKYEEIIRKKRQRNNEKRKEKK